jgi:hypothetical protein
MNPGFGIDRLLKVLYPKTKGLTESRYRLTMILNDNLHETGEDLYEELQNPEYSKMVTHEEFLEVTGLRNVPNGYGRRGSSTGKRGKKGSRASLVPLPPQEFKWGVLPLESEREHRQMIEEE